MIRPIKWFFLLCLDLLYIEYKTSRNNFVRFFPMGITCLFFRRRNRYKTQKNIKINSHLYGQKKNSSNLKYCRYFESIFRKFYLRNELRLLAGLYQIVLYPQSTINLFRRVVFLLIFRSIFKISKKYCNAKKNMQNNITNSANGTFLLCC